MLVCFRNGCRQPHTKTHATHTLSICTTTPKISSHIPESARYVSSVSKKSMTHQKRIKRIKPQLRKTITRSKRHQVTRCSGMLPVGLTLLVLHSLSLLGQQTLNSYVVFVLPFRATSTGSSSSEGRTPTNRVVKNTSTNQRARTDSYDPTNTKRDHGPLTCATKARADGPYTHGLAHPSASPFEKVCMSSPRAFGLCCHMSERFHDLGCVGSPGIVLPSSPRK